MIEDLQRFPGDAAAFACRGHVTAHEYEMVLKQHGKVRVYYQVGDDFAEIETGAVWEDIKVGMQHRRQWERIAVVTDGSTGSRPDNASTSGCAPVHPEPVSDELACRRRSRPGIRRQWR